MTAKNTRWTRELIFEQAQKYKTRTAFANGAQQAYAAARRKGLLDEVCAHMGTATIWDEETVTTEAAKYKTRGEFAKHAGGAYNFAVRNDILDKVCEHMPKNVHKSQRKWTKETVSKASRGMTRSQFRLANRSAYVTAHREGWLDDIFSEQQGNQ